MTTKYAGKNVENPRYKMGARVYVLGLPGNPMGRVTHQRYDGKGYGWKHKVELYKGQRYWGTAKYWSERTLRKVRSDCKKRLKK